MNCQICNNELDPTYGPDVMLPNPDFPDRADVRKGPIVNYVCRRVHPDGSVCGRRYKVNGDFLTVDSR